MRSSGAMLLLVGVSLLFLGQVSGLLTSSRQTFSTRGITAQSLSSCTVAAPPSDRLREDLSELGLGACHGMLHASGVRQLSDLEHLTEQQIADMGIDPFHRLVLLRAQIDMLGVTRLSTTAKPKLSTCVDGAFYQPVRQRFELDTTPPHDFCLEEISQSGIFKGRLFTPLECEQLNRMAEYHAYRPNSSGWTNEIYTLTAQHIQCKEIPGMVSITRPRFQQLFSALYRLYPGRIRPNSICYENDGEPHLVKYNGNAKGTELHTDNSGRGVTVTVNAALSAGEDFEGGGTYFTALDDTVSLQQGEMLIHWGDVEHAGAEITSGVRRLFIAFLALEWLDEEAHFS